MLALRLNILRFVGPASLHLKEDDSSDDADGKAAQFRPWRAKEAVWIASMDVLLAGVGYLL